MPINLQRAARIGLVEEVLLQLILSRASEREIVVAADELRLLCYSIGCELSDLYLRATSLIGEDGINAAEPTKEGGIAIQMEETTLIQLPTAISQALRQHGISEEFARSLYSQYAGLGELDEQEFIRLCLRERSAGKPERLSRHWQPGAFCHQGLAKKGVTATFIEDLVPEFILIFNERPRPVLSFDLEFFRFASKRWQRYINAFDENTDLRPLPERWQPSRDLIKELAKRGISESAIEEHLPLFRLQMRECGEVSRNWGALFAKSIAKK